MEVEGPIPSGPTKKLGSFAPIKSKLNQIHNMEVRVAIPLSSTGLDGDFAQIKTTAFL